MFFSIIYHISIRMPRKTLTFQELQDKINSILSQHNNDIQILNDQKNRCVSSKNPELKVHCNNYKNYHRCLNRINKISTITPQDISNNTSNDNNNITNDSDEDNAHRVFTFRKWFRIKLEALLFLCRTFHSRKIKNNSYEFKIRFKFLIRPK